MQPMIEALPAWQVLFCAGWLLMWSCRSLFSKYCLAFPLIVLCCSESRGSLEVMPWFMLPQQAAAQVPCCGMPSATDVHICIECCHFLCCHEICHDRGCQTWQQNAPGAPCRTAQ